MDIFEAMQAYGTQQLVFCYDKESGLKAIIGVHDTTLGPALGGCRVWNYATEDEAISDVLRLSRGMTYKNAAMGLSLGGGKAVVWADSRTGKTEGRLRALGSFIERLGGAYITAEDVGTSPSDMAHVAQTTGFVAGLAGRSGDPSPATAYGVYQGIRASLKIAVGSPDTAGRRIAIQGMGHVGVLLAERLRAEGAKVTATDIDSERVAREGERLGLSVVEPEAIYDVEADVFAPCALGAILNERTIPRLRVRAVAGSANNQLAQAEDAERLQERGIFYAPDFVVNGGGVIHVAEEFAPSGFSETSATVRVARIYDQILEIAEIARSEGITTHRAAEVLAERRIADLGRLLRLSTPELR